MNGLVARHPIVAVTYEYTDPIDQLFAEVTSALTNRGMQLAGFIQRDEPRNDRAKCDMILHELWSGEIFRISEDRGSQAKGCRLNVDWLLSASATVMRALESAPDLLIINKFGKAEAEGGGLRHLVVRGLELSVPILIAVPCRNLDSWQSFAGELAYNVTFSEAREKSSRLIAAITGTIPASSVVADAHAPMD